MRTIFRLAVLGLLIAATSALVFAGPPIAAQSPQMRSPEAATRRPQITLRTPKPPTVAMTADGAVLVCEVHVTNSSAQPWTLQKIEVLSSAAAGSPVLQTLAPDVIEASTNRPGTALAGPDRRVFAGAGWGVIYFWIPVDAAAPPPSIFHRLTFEASIPAGPVVRVLDGPAVPVLRDLATIGPPLRGGPWLANNGPSNETPHRRLLSTIEGALTGSERFAIDYVKLGADDAIFSGDRTVNENHHAYGAEVLAVADGVVVAILDGIPDLVGPPPPSGPEFILTGNYIILDIGQTRYAMYAHLKPGSLRVKAGQRIKRGDVIALLGNSGGGTGAPHLHFQLQDTPRLAAEGLPYRHESFEVLGRCQGPPVQRQCTRTAAATARNQVPLNGMIAQFPR
jgi:murein DD-endopeptidase MepM/ murein hydrolase activator NlpD